MQVTRRKSCKKQKTQEVTCCDIAKKVVNGDRRQDYGPVTPSLISIARIWGGILNVDVTPEQVALCMAGLKLARESHQHKEDNLVDFCGYALVLEKYYQEK